MIVTPYSHPEMTTRRTCLDKWASVPVTLVTVISIFYFRWWVVPSHYHPKASNKTNLKWEHPTLYRNCAWSHCVTGNALNTKWPTFCRWKPQDHVINQHCFRQWLGAKEAISHYLSQWCSSMLTHICVTRHQCLVLLHTEMLWRNIKYNDIAQITETSRCGRQWLVYHKQAIPWLIETLWRKESGHHQPRYGHTFPAISGPYNKRIDH